jgi:hypothetical protein
MKSVIGLLSLILLCNVSYGQILWTVENESINLNPTEVTENAQILIKDVVIAGTTIFNFVNKEMYFQDKNGVYRLETNDVEEINSIFGKYTSRNLFDEKSVESIRVLYRYKLYEKLNLNKITFCLSKNPIYSIQNGTLELKNSKIVEGKICGITPTEIILVDTVGNLISVTDRELVFLNFLGKRYFRTSQLYNIFYSNYDEQLIKTIESWRNKIIGKSLENIVFEEGPYDRIIELGENKIFIWEWSSQTFFVNLGNSSSNLSVSSVNSSIQGNTISSVFGSSSGLFTYNKNGSSSYLSSVSSISGLYLNKYLLNGMALGLNQSVSNLKGTVTSRQDEVKFSVLVDKGKVSEVFHENIFSYPSYGRTFKFVNY